MEPVTIAAIGGGVIVVGIGAVLAAKAWNTRQFETLQKEVDAAKRPTGAPSAGRHLSFILGDSGAAFVYSRAEPIMRFVKKSKDSEFCAQIDVGILKAATPASIALILTLVFNQLQLTAPGASKLQEYAQEVQKVISVQGESPPKTS